MSDYAIRVENLGKKYRISGAQGRQKYVALRDVLADSARKFGRRLAGRGASVASPSNDDFWALRDVSFSVGHGQSIGVIGSNGAGKSTLLKILSRITEPTEGRVRLRGRVASLLEVGTGFHPELTGRENIYLNGAVLGMRRDEIGRRFDEIVAFADVDRFVDTPVKKYSSGMYVRLAFAVAAHIDPEILIVDEVLAVGDARFQRKCIGQMDAVAKSGRTVLFVSHNMSLIQTLCSRAVLLERGRLVFDGSSSEATALYQSNDDDRDSVTRVPKAGSTATITHLQVLDVCVRHQTFIRVKVDVSVSAEIGVALELKLFDAQGTAVGMASVGLLDSSAVLLLSPGGESLTLDLTLPRLAHGLYKVVAQLTIPLVSIVDTTENGVVFEVQPDPVPGSDRPLELGWGCGALEIPVKVSERRTTRTATLTGPSIA